MLFVAISIISNEKTRSHGVVRGQHYLVSYRCINTLEFIPKGKNNTEVYPDEKLYSRYLYVPRTYLISTIIDQKPENLRSQEGRVDSHYNKFERKLNTITLI